MKICDLPPPLPPPPQKKKEKWYIISLFGKWGFSSI